MRAPLLVLLVALVATATMFAQAAPGGAEFGRASGGDMKLITKAPRALSGSLALGLGRGYEGTLGGEIVRDRLWFFGAGAILPGAKSAGLSEITLKTTAQPVDWSSVVGSYRQSRRPVFGTALEPNGQAFGSFLSLHSTTVLSDRAIMSFSFSRQNADR
ncbi:MAG TPA: hypothetical protein VJ276_24560 [Thermoanaerobaculia bacterium]|nr:hypothetical protein [Thermoanaerobaculia bacterium]